MEAISRTLYNLLAQRQTVILPQLGTLRVERDTIGFDPAGGAVPVPRNRIVFSPEEKEGETLPGIIARKSGKTVKEIKPLYNRWIAGVKSTAGQGKMTIEGVAVLVRQPDGSYRVEPATGLDGFLNPLDIQTVQIPLLKPLKNEKKQPSREAGSKVSPSSGAGKSPKKHPGRRTVAIAAGITLAALLVYGGYYAYTRGFFDGKPDPAPAEHTNQPVSQPEPSLEKTDPVSSAPLSADSVATEQPVSPAGTSGQENRPVEPLPELPAGEVYHIIAGVFSTRENAERFVRENAFPPSVTTLIPTTGERFMVSVGRFSGKEEADREMDRLREKIPQAWISKRKK